MNNKNIPLRSLLIALLCCFGALPTVGENIQIGAPAKRPNVLIWLIDDAGFAHLGSYGGLVETPVLDRIAQQGLRYTNFHTTAICSATRAALLTGRNHHAVNMGSVTDLGVDIPGYSGKIPKSAASLARVLQLNGYVTVALGKWHQTPGIEASIAGPFDSWPSGQGFDHFYGFMGGDTHQFFPQLWADHRPIEPATTHPNYDMAVDLADRAIEYFSANKAAAPDRPVFMYYATGAVHSPHHAPQSYIDKYKGRFDLGWDKAREQILARQKKLNVVPKNTQIPPRPEGIPAWNSLNADEKKVATRAMEVFAAQLEQADHEFGRIVQQLEKMGELDNTIILVTSDNGASAEGGPNGTFNEVLMMNNLTATTQQNLTHIEQWGRPEIYNHYPAGWAMAGNTPFKFYKQTVHAGGVRDPLIVSWPGRIAQTGQVRTQFHHINDIMPTVLDMAGVERPQAVDGVQQEPFDGVSMRYSFAAAQEPTHKQAQYFNMSGNIAIWADGWKAVLMHRPEPWHPHAARDYSKDRWELYHTEADFNEMHDLAEKEPAKLAELQALYASEAKRNNAGELGATTIFKKGLMARDIARLAATGGHFVYHMPGATRVVDALSPPIKNRSYRIETTIDVPAGGAQGVIVSNGGHSGGYSLYALNNHLAFAYNYLQTERYVLRSQKPLPTGRVNVVFEFTKTGQGAGKGELRMNGEVVATGEIARTIVFMLPLSETFDVGIDKGTAVSTDYVSPFPFSGGLEKVEFFVSDN